MGLRARLATIPPLGEPRQAWRAAEALVARWGPDVFLARALLGATVLAALAYTTILAVHAEAQGRTPWPTVIAATLVVGSLSWAQTPRGERHALALALLAGAGLALLTVVNRAYDPLVYGMYGAALVLAALVLSGRDTLAITAHYFVYYALYNVLVADPALAGLHWEELLATLLVFAGIALAVWSLVAGQRWLRTSRAAIAKANAQLAATLDREQRFVGDAAHQLRTPLAILRGSIELLETQEAPDTASVQRTLHEVSREAERLGHTIDDLLALSRADAGLAIAHETVDVLELADVVYAQGRRRPGGERLVLDLGDEPERWPWLVRGDERLLEQLLLNLIDNALKYSPEDRPVRLALATVADSIVLAVSDHGPGIPPEEQERIFERFYRAAPARAGRVPGSGLGLCLARWIAEAHHGRLELTSAPGRGSTFRLVLRAASPDA